MELNLDHIKFLKSRKSSSPKPKTKLDVEFDNEILDLSGYNFGSDETWLYTVPMSFQDYPKDLCSWLHDDSDRSFEETTEESEPLPKNIDTRTFTRPKKPFARPSIERYNEEMYGDAEGSTRRLLSRSSASGVIQENPETTLSKPLPFDLSQPTNSFYFDNILANCAEGESFQNMSPPSLVNSMCSSTFANLMESSFIKNDPVLREIRDADYTDSVLLQDSEPPMFQSFTESCSSIASSVDGPETFLKRVSAFGSFRRSQPNRETGNETFVRDVPKNGTFAVADPGGTFCVNEETFHADKEDENSEPTTFTGTYRRTPKLLNGTFKKSDLKNLTITVNTSPDQPEADDSPQNRTRMLIKDCSVRSFEGTRTYDNIKRDDTLENIKNELFDHGQTKDLNRLSYGLEDENGRLDSGYTEINNEELNRTVKRLSIGCSTGSADSLDRMSSISNSSRESNRILNMADVDAIVEKQEQSLNQVMSTPKPNVGPKRFFENNFISPIVPLGPLSDSELSSNEDYRSARSSNSKESENYATKTKSMGYLAGPIDTKIKTNPRGTFTATGQRPLQALPQNMRSSYGNLKKSQTTGSYQNLYRPSSVKLPTSAASSNLNSMGSKLKGSYTSLRPPSAHLPVAPPPLTTSDASSKTTVLNTTRNIESPQGRVVAEVHPRPREKAADVIGDSTFVKPLPPKTSSLPRPTGIPRPASRIPAPRTTMLRPASSRSSLHKKESNCQ